VHQGYPEGKSKAGQVICRRLQAGFDVTMCLNTPGQTRFQQDRLDRAEFQINPAALLVTNRLRARVPVRIDKWWLYVGDPARPVIDP
jgi:hypothetical protein